MWPRDVLKKVSRGLCRVEAGNPGFPRLVQVTSGEVEDTKKRWQEYTEELYKKDLHDPDNHDGVITHLERDILEGEVKWALESITMNKASGGDGIPVAIF